MKRSVTILLLCFVVVGLFAQWSVDAGVPNLVAGFTGEQVIPKVAVTDSGKTYICRFDNSSGGYKVWLNLLSPQGVPLWTAPEGLLVSEHTSMTWLTDYDMTADNDGNAVIVFQDIRNAGVNNVFAYKISPEGVFLWGADGITLSADTSTDFSNMSPTVFNSTDNSTYVAWQHSATTTSIGINRISTEGQKLWGENGITISAMEGSYNWPQIIQGECDNILLKYYHDTGPFWAPNRHIYVAKYNATGQRIWNALMSDAEGLPAWQQLIPFESDGAGGALLSWYEDRENDMDQDVYVQRVNSAGTTTMPDDGALITQDTVNQQYYPLLAVDELNQKVYAFYRVTDANQNLYGIGRQLLDFAGNRLWGDTAPLIVEIGTQNADMVSAYYTQSGAICLFEFGSDNLYASCWRSSGNQGWQEGFSLIANTPDTKYHYDYSVHPDHWMVLAWEQGMSEMDIYAMRLNSDGSLGMQYPAPQGLTATLMPPDDIQLTWQEPSQFLLPESYDIYMNGNLLLSSAGDVWTIQLLNLPPETYNFYVIAIYAGGFSSVPSETVTISVVANDDDTTPWLDLSLRLAPNPFHSSANLSFALNRAAPEGRISVYNIKGQKLFEQSFSATAGKHSYSLDSELFRNSGTGVYFIKLVIDEYSHTLKAIFIN